MTDKLVLGTAQLGLDYGINNKRGKPRRKEAVDILDRALNGGINLFDTAQAYGDAEEILGEWIKSISFKNKISIISKLKPHAVAEVSESEIANLIEEEVKKSLLRLKRDYLDGYLLHTPEYIYNGAVWSAMESVKKKGLVRNIGVSVYEEKDALHAVKERKVDYIQIPYSVFDQRFNKIDFFETAKKNNVKVFARSAFLQGLIFMDKNEIPEHLSEARQYLYEFDGVIKKHGFTRAEAALLFSYKNPDIDYVVFGADNTEQLEENLRVVKTQKNFDACMLELRSKFTDLKKSIIMPSLWKTLNKDLVK